MSKSLIIHGIPASQPTRSVYWTCLIKGLPFELRPVDLASANARSLLLELNPTGQVPTIEDALELDGREYLAADTRALDAFYGLGWMIVANIGYEKLHSLAERLGSTDARPVPPEAILTAAGLDLDDDTSIRRGFARKFELRGAEGDAPINIYLSD